jgi:hypothetical protein
VSSLNPGPDGHPPLTDLVGFTGDLGFFLIF